MGNVAKSWKNHVLMISVCIKIFDKRIKLVCIHFAEEMRPANAGARFCSTGTSRLQYSANGRSRKAYASAKYVPNPMENSTASVAA